MTKSPNPYAEAYAGFLRSTADHGLVILQDDGLYRHLRVQKPNTRMWSWDVVTWPGHLATSGDIADGYIFARNPDMLTFFELPQWQQHYYSDGAPGIDVRYWAEKICGDRAQDIKRYDKDVFLRHVRATLDEHEELSEGAIAEVRANDTTEADHLAEQRADKLHRAEISSDSECYAREWLQHPEQAEIFGEDASWDWVLSAYTSHFVVSCYCIELTVRLYREAQARAQVDAVVELAKKSLARELRALKLRRRHTEKAAAIKARIRAAHAGITLLTRSSGGSAETTQK
ncbi:hypothetical protein [Amycolatopsis sp. CA-230715]|uniref:hypothetical protein n=1 Tax=Amycolatopsis sp. CA-230715 TaxID=2745196 RepID=UPI001C020876|nr:hypothetical protein [Amycolatopsis sp. CA-230715]QWF85683.1 hypothetical protein HUW46_09163 [Amycolatopsis sp. CA-230715]